MTLGPRVRAPLTAGAHASTSRFVFAFLLRRLIYAAGTIVLTAFFAYGLIRLLRPELYPGESLVSRNVRGGRARAAAPGPRRCLHVLRLSAAPRLWLDGLWADLFLLAGGMVVAIMLGIAGGLWCAARPRSRASRALECVAMVFFVQPAYVVGFTLLLLFAPPFGLVQLPCFFDPHSYTPPLQDPWDFFRSMIMPWLVVGAPLAGAFLRLTLALASTRWARTTCARRWPRACRGTSSSAATPPRRPRAVASLFGASAPIMVTNIVLVEYVFSVPGFFRHMRRALGQAPGWPPSLDIPTLQALAHVGGRADRRAQPARRPRDRPPGPAVRAGGRPPG